MDKRISLTLFKNLSYLNDDDMDLYIIFKNGSSFITCDQGKTIYKKTRDNQICKISINDDGYIIDIDFIPFNYTYKEFIKSELYQPMKNWWYVYIDNYNGKTKSFYAYRRCPECNKGVFVEVKYEDMIRFMNNDYNYIQDLFPYSTPSEREIFLSGLCNDCWNKLFKEE